MMRIIFIFSLPFLVVFVSWLVFLFAMITNVGADVETLGGRRNDGDVMV